MTLAPVPASPGEFTFLVERYVPVGDLEDLARAVDRVAAACADAPTGSSVCYVQSTFVPGDDTCFCVFRAPSAEAVHAVNAAARFTVDRISAAITLTPSLSKESL